MSIINGNQSARDRVFQLLSAQADGWLDGGQRLELIELVRGDASARAAYAEYAVLQSLLHHKSSVAVSPAIDSLLSATAGSPVAANAEAESPAFPSVSPMLSPLAPAFVGGPVFSYMVASVVLCLMLLGAWAYKITHVEMIVEDKPTNNAIEDSEYKVVGRVSGMKDCAWPKDALVTMVGASVPMGRKYVLSSGLLEITYDSGAKVILEGPCEYTADSRDGGFLRIGKLVARVEKKVASVQWPVARKERRGGREEGLIATATSTKPQAANLQPPAPSPQPPLSTIHSQLFTITTPTAVVTDLGTEFGVEVSQTGRTKTQVFDGSVRLKKIIPSGAADDGCIITAGQSGIVDSNVPTIRVANDRSTAFVRIIPGSAPYLDNNAYAKFVMSLGPVAYYRMERPEYGKDRKTVYDSAPGKRHGILRTISQAGKRGRELNATPLDGQAQKSGPISGNNRDAEKAPRTTENLFAAPSFSTSAKEGNHAIEFNRGRHGVMDAHAAFSPLLITDGFSCSCWFKVVGDDQYYGRILDMRAESVNWSGLSIYIDQSDNGDKDGDPGTIGLDLDYSIAKGGLLPIQYAPDAVQVGEWCHMAVTCGAQYWSEKASGYVTDVALYLNGKKIAGGTEYAEGGTLSFGNNARCFQSSQSKHDREFGGLIDEAAIFNRVLSLDEVRRLYKGPITVGNRHNNPETTIDRSVNGKENKTVIDP